MKPAILRTFAIFISVFSTKAAPVPQKGQSWLRRKAVAANVVDEDGSYDAGNSKSAGEMSNVFVGPLPGYVGDFLVEGVLTAREIGRSTITITGNLTGLEPSASGGIHIHEGNSCSRSAIGGHLFSKFGVFEDPWIGATYSSNDHGDAAVALTMETFSLQGNENPVVGHVLIVHDSLGAEVGCGVLLPPRSGAASNSSTVAPKSTSTSASSMENRVDSILGSAAVDRLFGYSGKISVTGTVNARNSGGTGVAFTGSLEGLEASSRGGVHVHEGVACDATGDHLATADGTDPWNWKTTTYFADGNGRAALDFEVTDFSLDQVLNRVVVVHAENGAKVGCGVLAPISDESEMPNQSVDPNPVLDPVSDDAAGEEWPNLEDSGSGDTGSGHVGGGVTGDGDDGGAFINNMNPPCPRTCAPLEGKYETCETWVSILSYLTSNLPGASVLTEVRGAVSGGERLWVRRTPGVFRL